MFIVVLVQNNRIMSYVICAYHFWPFQVSAEESKVSFGVDYCLSEVEYQYLYSFLSYFLHCIACDNFVIEELLNKDHKFLVLLCEFSFTLILLCLLELPCSHGSTWTHFFEFQFINFIFDQVALFLQRNCIFQNSSIKEITPK